MTRAKALAKVRSLRALAARAGSQAEAETAMGRAWVLTQEHGLSEEEIGGPPKASGNGRRSAGPGSTRRSQDAGAMAPDPRVYPLPLDVLREAVEQGIERAIRDGLARLGRGRW